MNTYCNHSTQCNCLHNSGLTSGQKTLVINLINKNPYLRQSYINAITSLNTVSINTTHNQNTSLNSIYNSHPNGGYNCGQPSGISPFR